MLKSASWQSYLPRGTQSRNHLSHVGTQRIPVLAMKSMWPGNWTKGVSILSCRCIEVCDDGNVHFDLELRLRILELPGVVRLVSFNGQPATLPEYEIETL